PELDADPDVFAGTAGRLGGAAGRGRLASTSAAFCFSSPTGCPAAASVKAHGSTKHLSRRSAYLSASRWQKHLRLRLQQLTGVHDVERVKNPLDTLHPRDGLRTVFFNDEVHFVQT